MNSRVEGNSSGLRSSALFLAAVLLLLVTGALTRLIDIADFPPQIHNDESSSAIDGVAHFMDGSGGWALAGSAFGGHPNLSYWLSAIPARITGELSIRTLRLGAAVSGILSLLFVALFVSKAFGRRVTLYTLLFIAPYHYHAHFSRTGFPYIHAVLFMSLVSAAFAWFVESPTLRRSLLVGIAMGLAALVYPATHVLPFAIGAAVMLWLLPTLISTRGWKGGSIRFIKLVMCFMTGLIVAVGPQAAYSYSHGYTSRLTQTFVLHEHNIKHLRSQMNDPHMTKTEIVWANFLRTLKIFYSDDTGEQYQFNESPLPLVGGIVTLCGLGVLLWRGLRRDPLAVYLIVTGGLTIVTSALMVEGNFSPHTVLLSVLIPIVAAIGWDKILSTLRIRHVALASVATLLIGVAWADWNWKFYNRVVSPTRSRFGRPTYYVLRLPIDHKSVRHVVNAGAIDLNFSESYYPLVYPAASKAKLVSTTPPSEVADLIGKSQLPCVVVEDKGDFPALKTILESRGRKLHYFTYPEIDLVYMYIE